MTVCNQAFEKICRDQELFTDESFWWINILQEKQ